MMHIRGVLVTVWRNVHNSEAENSSSPMVIVLWVARQIDYIHVLLSVLAGAPPDRLLSSERRPAGRSHAVAAFLGD